MVNCELSHRCWRCVYSQYYKDQGSQWKEGRAPTRDKLVLLGYATDELAEKFTRRSDGKKLHKGIFATVIPNGQGTQGMCPVMLGGVKDYCPEYQEWLAKKKRKVSKGNLSRIKIPKSLREQVSRRDKFTCQYCKRHLSVLKQLGMRGVIDHVIPIARGGLQDCASNLVFACWECNNDKATEIWELGCRVGYYG